MKTVGISILILGLLLLCSGIMLDAMGWPGDDAFRLPGSLGIAGGAALMIWARFRKRPPAA